MGMLLILSFPLLPQFQFCKAQQNVLESDTTLSFKILDPHVPAPDSRPMGPLHILPQLNPVIKTQTVLMESFQGILRTQIKKENHFQGKGIEGL